MNTDPQGKPRATSNHPPIRRRRHTRAVLLSIIIPFILLVALVGGAGYLGAELEKVQLDTVRAIGDWYKLDVTTRRHFSFHEGAPGKDQWNQDIRSIEETLGRLRTSRALWLLGNSVADRFARTDAAWHMIKNKLMEGDLLFQEAQRTTLAKLEQHGLRPIGQTRVRGPRSRGFGHPGTLASLSP